MRPKLLITTLCLLISGCAENGTKTVNFDLSSLINKGNISVFEIADRDPVNLWGIKYPTEEELLNKWKPWLEQLDSEVVSENMSDEHLGTLAYLYFYFIRSLKNVGDKLLPEGQTTEFTRDFIIKFSKNAMQSLKKIEPILEKRQPMQYSTLFLSAEYDLKQLIVLNAVALMVYAKIEYPNYLRQYYSSLGYRNDKQIKSIDFFEEQIHVILEQLDESKDENIYYNVLEDITLDHPTLFNKLHHRLYFDFPFYSPHKPHSPNKELERRREKFLEYLRKKVKRAQP